MLNISFGEIVVVAVVGLIVIGPQRLPQAARFVGHLISRLQRQAADIKADIRREMDLEDLKGIQREYESASRAIGDDFRKHQRDLRDAADSAAESFTAAKNSASDAARDNSANATSSSESDSASGKNLVSGKTANDSADANSENNSAAHSPPPWPQHFASETGDAHSVKNSDDEHSVKPSPARSEHSAQANSQKTH